MCCLTRLTTIVAAAAAAWASVTIGTGRSCSPATGTTSIDERTSQPSQPSAKPYAARTSRWPSAVAPPWLPMAGTRNGMAPWARTQATIRATTVVRSLMPREPMVIATSLPGSRSTPQAASVRSVSPATSSSDGSSSRMRTRWNRIVVAHPASFHA